LPATTTLRWRCSIHPPGTMDVLQQFDLAEGAVKGACPREGVLNDPIDQLPGSANGSGRTGRW
jgi:hypothetical protein